jgi:hypothetical protein
MFPFGVGANQWRTSRAAEKRDERQHMLGSLYIHQIGIIRKWQAGGCIEPLTRLMAAAATAGCCEGYILHPRAGQMGPAENKGPP